MYSFSMSASMRFLIITISGLNNCTCLIMSWTRFWSVSIFRVFMILTIIASIMCYLSIFISDSVAGLGLTLFVFGTSFCFAPIGGVKTTLTFWFLNAYAIFIFSSGANSGLFKFSFSMTRFLGLHKYFRARFSSASWSCIFWLTWL